MDQYNNNNQSEFLWKLLANPANDAHVYAYDLQRLVNDFPQSGILQALLAHASDNKNLKQASAYFDTRALFKLINSPGSLAGISDDRIIIERASSNGSHQQQPEAQQTVETAPVADEEAPEPAVDYHPTPDTIPVQETEPTPSAREEIQEEIKAEEQPAQIPADEMPPPLPPAEAIAPLDETPAVAEPEEAEPEIAHEEIPPVPDVAANESVPAPIDQDITTVVPEMEQPGQEFINTEEPPPVPAAVEQPEKQIADEVFDEIVSIEQIDINPAASHLDEDRQAEEKQDAGQNAVNGDHFMFDRTFGRRGSEDDSQPAPQADDEKTAAEQNTQSDDQQDLSKYFDEKMPYTFMWWLDKTRKEHAGTYQPYAKGERADTGNRSKKSVDELQQQYFENIFHITSVEELDKHTAATKAPNAAPIVPKRKEQVIIERFIKEEPQIRPQSSDKIDNENKAKKSSEDRDELVTETLASIYSEQMLYHKAIASYKKLMLKFPEKSRYFADKIEQLEKKTI